MARVNIEDQFWLEVVAVAVKVGDQDKAIGNAVRFFRFAQEKHKNGRMVSEDEFLANGFHEALIPTFATRTDKGIKAVGSDKHFGWLAERVKAGSKGGQARSSKAKQKQAKSGKVKQVQPSPSPSPSPSCSELNPLTPFEGGMLHPLATLWNQSITKLRKVQKTEDKRLTACQKATGKRSLEEWGEIFRRADRAPFLAGGGARGWKASLEWVLKNANRIDEGEFDVEQPQSTFCGVADVP